MAVEEVSKAFSMSPQTIIGALIVLLLGSGGGTAVASLQRDTITKADLKEYFEVYDEIDQVRRDALEARLRGIDLSLDEIKDCCNGVDKK